MDIVIIAWDGDMSLGFYAVPRYSVQVFLDKYQDVAGGHWQVLPTPDSFAHHFLANV